MTEFHDTYVPKNGRKAKKPSSYRPDTSGRRSVSFVDCSGKFAIILSRACSGGLWSSYRMEQNGPNKIESGNDPYKVLQLALIAGPTLPAQIRKMEADGVEMEFDIENGRLANLKK